MAHAGPCVASYAYPVTCKPLQTTKCQRKLRNKRAGHTQYIPTVSATLLLLETRTYAAFWCHSVAHHLQKIELRCDLQHIKRDESKQLPPQPHRLREHQPSRMQDLDQRICKLWFFVHFPGFTLDDRHLKTVRVKAWRSLKPPNYHLQHPWKPAA
jgi:hypothetical protein